MGSMGWFGDAVSTPSSGTIIAALPRCGQTRVDAIVVEVEDVGEPGVVTIGDVDDVEVRSVDDVVVVGEPDVGELAPTRRPTTSAPSARGIKMKRPNFDGSDAFTSLIYIVLRCVSGTVAYIQRCVAVVGN
jgi:hypothetical protein